MLFSLPRFRWAFGFAAAIAVVAGLMFAFWPTSPSPPTISATIDVGGETRRYRLAAPGAIPDASLPIIVVFHGIGDTPESIAAYSRLDRLAAAGKAYVVYPETRLGMWNIGAAQPENFAENRDLQLLDLLLDRLRLQLKSDRVALVGMSNGATFVLLAAHVRSDIDCVVAHSGSKPRELASEQPTPLLLFVGKHDPVAAAVRQDADQYRAAGVPVRLLEDPGLGHQWSSRFDDEIDAFLTTPKQDR